jgi:phage-related minor tail protein
MTTDLEARLTALERQVEMISTHLESQRRNQARQERESDVRVQRVESFAESELGNLSRRMDQVYLMVEKTDKSLRGDGADGGLVGRIAQVEHTAEAVRRVSWWGLALVGGVLIVSLLGLLGLSQSLP